jgi:hypothetical protein
MKKLKHASTARAHAKKIKDENSLIYVECKLDELYYKEGVGYFSKENKVELILL